MTEEKLLKLFNEFLDEDWRNQVGTKSVEELKATLADVAKKEEANQAAKEEDSDLAQQKEAYQTALAGYKEATKVNKLKTKFALRVLATKES